MQQAGVVRSASGHHAAAEQELGAPAGPPPPFPCSACYYLLMLYAVLQHVLAAGMPTLNDMCEHTLYKATSPALPTEWLAVNGGESAVYCTSFAYRVQAALGRLLCTALYRLPGSVSVLGNLRGRCAWRHWAAQTAQLATHCSGCAHELWALKLCCC